MKKNTTTPEQQKGDSIRLLLHEVHMAVEKLWEKASESPEEFLSVAREAPVIPINLWRDKSMRERQFQYLQDEGFITNRPGRPYDPLTIINREVAEACLIIRTFRMFKSTKECSWLPGIKIPEITKPGVVPLIELPELSPDTVKLWKPWLEAVFLEKYAGHPENDPELKNLVMRRLGAPDSKVPAAEIRNQIKRDFHKAIPRFARWHSLSGD
ncbi:MAG: hypothetical protein CL727_06925 [Chloroflexi bacterium]|jgi:hypothetical protein|nr:hypothetical protein [Chloroflexota bacterium]